MNLNEPITNIAEASAILKRMRYKGGREMKFKLHDNLRGRKMCNALLVELVSFGTDSDSKEYEAPDSNKASEFFMFGATQSMIRGGRIVMLPVTRKNFLLGLLDGLKSRECHEAAEWFKVDGEKLFDPHKDYPDTRWASPIECWEAGAAEADAEGLIEYEQPEPPRENEQQRGDGSVAQASGRAGCCAGATTAAEES